jgi:hypothetical protein
MTGDIPSRVEYPTRRGYWTPLRGGPCYPKNESVSVLMDALPMGKSNLGTAT